MRRVILVPTPAVATVSTQVLKDALLELEQMHSHYVKDCGGGCPTHKVMAELRMTLGVPPLATVDCS